MHLYFESTELELEDSRLWNGDEERAKTYFSAGLIYKVVDSVSIGHGGGGSWREGAR